MSESTIIAPQTPGAKPRITYLDKSSVIDSYESYNTNGFQHLLLQSTAERRYQQEKRFLSSIDLTKQSNVFVTVNSIIRTMAPDWTDPERRKKEYMMVNVNFESKNTKNVTMNYLLEDQGKYVEQTKEIQTKTVNGEDVNVYVRGAAPDVYSMEWDKKKAQEMLTNKKYFGEDTINSINPGETVFTVKFPGQNPSRTSFSQEEFMNLTYQALWDRARTTPSPQLDALKRRQNPYS